MSSETDEPTDVRHSDSSPISNDETLMRRVLKRQAEYDRGKMPPLQAGAFLPTKRDGTGLSLNRRKSDKHPTFLTPEQLKNWHEVPENIRESCGVLEILTQKVKDTGLTITADPASTPGHVLIEELNWEDFAGSRETDASRRRIMEWALKLTRAAEITVPPGRASRA